MSPRVPPLLVLASLLLVGSCVRSESPTQVDGPVAVPLYISPALIPSPANAGALPINRIRARAARVEDGVLLGETEIDVDPAATEWQLDLEVMATSEPVDVSVFISLLHVSGDAESVQFSGLATPVTVVVGETVEPADIDLVRGPLDNLFTTGVGITESPDTLYEGRTATIGAVATATNDAEPTVYLTALDSAVLSVTNSSVTGVAPGTGRFAASAGAFADTAAIYVRPAPTGIDVSPDSLSVATPGEQASFTAVVTDVRGDTLTEETVTWRTPTPSIVSSLGGGIFQAEAPGMGRVEAVSDAEPAVVGSAIFVVEGASQPTPDLSVSAAVDDATPADGDTIEVIVDVANAPGAVDATSVEVTHRAGTGLTVLAATPDQGSFDLQTGVWSVGALTEAGLASLVLEMEVAVGTSGQTLADSAWISASTPVDPDIGDDTASVSLSVTQRSVDVAVLKEVDQAQPQAGDPVTFTVSVANSGTGTVTDVAVWDSLDVIFESPSHSVSVGSLIGDTLWTIPSLAQGDTATWTTTATVSANAAGTSVTNSAVLRAVSQNDTTPANDAATVAVDVALSLLPTVTISAPADSSVFEPNELVTFTGAANDPEDGDVSPSIEWLSSLDGVLGSGRSVSTDQLSTGVHTVSATATDADGGVGADTITVTVALYTIPTTLNVPFGGTASLPISLTEPAPAGGVTLSVTSGDETVTRPQSSTVVIPEGAQSANATLEGLSPGTTDVSVSSVQFGVVTSTVSVTAQLNILSSTVRFPSTFTRDIEIQLESGGSPLAAPMGGLTVSFVSSDPGCVSPPADLLIPEGLINATTTLAYGGNGALPCTTFVSAVAQDVEPDSVQATVDPQPQITVSNPVVGSGLQAFASVSLGATLPDGQTLTVTSPSPNVLLAPDASTVGTQSLDLAGPFTSRSFVVQVLEGFTGEVTLTASAPGFTDGSGLATGIEPGVRVVGVATSTTTLSGNDAFYAQIGRTNGSGGWVGAQQLRAGAEPVTLTFTSSVPSVATLFTEANGSGSPQSLTLQPGSSNTPTSVAGGGIAVDPLTEGSTVISAEAVNFGFVTTNSTTVQVSAPQITMSNPVVGSGLQAFASVSLGATLPDGQTLTVTSPSPNVLLAPDASTVGTQSLDLAGPFTSRNFVVQVLEGFTGEVTLTASAPGFTDGSGLATGIEPGVRVVGVATSTTTLSGNDAFYAQIGRTNGSGAWVGAQQLRAGAEPVTLTFTSSVPSVATLFTEVNGSGSPQSLTLQPGSSNTPTSVAGGGIAVDPLTEGSTAISAEAVNFGFVTTNSTTVQVSAPQITVSNPVVGSGLQAFASVSLGATLPDGQTLTVTSPSPNVLLAPDASTVGTQSLDLAGPFTSRNFMVQVLEGFTGEVTLTASAPGFTDGSGLATGIEPGVRVVGVATSTTTLSGNDAFYAQIGRTNGSGAWVGAQQLRAGAEPLTLTFTSSVPSVATLFTEANGSGSPQSLTLQPGSSNTPTSVAGGGIAVDPLTEGSTAISAEAVNFGFVTTNSTTVQVSAPQITVSNPVVGSGLQAFASVSLGATLPDGQTLTVTSSSPFVLLAPDASTVGTQSLDLAGPFTSRNFVVQVLEGFTGEVTLTASAPGFTDGSGTATTVEPGIRLVGVSTSNTVGGADDAFYAQIGRTNGSGAWVGAQQLRAGAEPLTLTFTSSVPSVATLFTEANGAGSPQSLILQPGSSNTPTSVAGGGIAVDPLAEGSTQVSVAADAFISTSQAFQNVTINP